MKSKKRRVKRKRRKPVILFLALGFVGVAVAGGTLWGIKYLEEKNARKTPEELLLLYMGHISRQEYEDMYEMLDPAASSTGSREEFVNRNSAIYKGIEMQNMQVEVKSYDQEELAVTYQTSFDTAAGKMSFENKAFFVDGEDSYKIAWNDSLIFLNWVRQIRSGFLCWRQSGGKFWTGTGMSLQGGGRPHRQELCREDWRTGMGLLQRPPGFWT